MSQDSSPKAVGVLPSAPRQRALGLSRSVVLSWRWSYRCSRSNRKGRHRLPRPSATRRSQGQISGPQAHAGLPPRKASSGKGQLPLWPGTDSRAETCVPTAPPRQVGRRHRHGGRHPQVLRSNLWPGRKGLSVQAQAEQSITAYPTRTGQQARAESRLGPARTESSHSLQEPWGRVQLKARRLIPTAQAATHGEKINPIPEFLETVLKLHYMGLVCLSLRSCFK